LYYKHNLDKCPAYGEQGHPLVERTLLVGYSCDKHSANQQHQDQVEASPGIGHGSHSRHQQRWDLLSPLDFENGSEQQNSEPSLLERLFESVDDDSGGGQIFGSQQEIDTFLSEEMGTNLRESQPFQVNGDYHSDYGNEMTQKWSILSPIH
jgi:hypothetical protein